MLSTLVLQRPETQQEKGLRSSSAAQAMIGEAALALRLRCASRPPSAGCALVADRAALAHLRRNRLHALWDRRIALPDPSRTAAAAGAAAAPPPGPAGRGAVALQVAALLLTPFNETVYLDLDVLVLSPSFLADLFERSLRVADLAAPNDPRARRGSTPRSTGSTTSGAACRRRAPRSSRIASRRQCGGGCSRRRPPACRTAPSTSRRAASPTNGDQELIWRRAGAVERPPDAGLRLMQLPRSTTAPCAAAGPTCTSSGRRSTGRSSLAPADGDVAALAHELGKYRCKALHGHLGANDRAARI